MTQLLVKTIADFSTTLTTKTAIGATTATLTTGLDSDGVQLPTGTYGFTVDRNSASKEHFTATLTGAALTNIQTVTRGTGVGTAGLLREHRKGAEVIITDHVSLKRMMNVLDGTTNLDSATPLGYDGTASISTANQLATKAYVDDVAVAGAPDASTTVKGIVEEATQTEVLAKTTAGGTSARLFVNPSTLASTLLSDYKVDTGVANAYVITPTPAITAYTVGQIFSFKAVNANTTTSTLNVNGLGVKTINKGSGATALASGDIAAGMIVVVEYDGTNFVMLNPVAGTVSLTSGAYPAGDGSLITGLGGRLNTVTTDVTFSSSTAENTLLSYSLAGGVLSTANAVRVTMHVTGLGVTGSNTWTLRFKYGATTLATKVYTNVTGNNTFTGKMEFILAGAGTTSSQNGSYALNLGLSNYVANASILQAMMFSESAQGTASEDSTASKTLAITSQHSNSSASDNITVSLILVEKITG